MTLPAPITLPADDLAIGLQEPWGGIGLYVDGDHFHVEVRSAEGVWLRNYSTWDQARTAYDRAVERLATADIHHLNKVLTPA